MTARRWCWSLAALLFLAPTGGHGAESATVLLDEWQRLEAVRLRIQANERILEHIRTLTLKLIETKHAEERKRLRERFEQLMQKLRGESSEKRDQLIAQLERYLLRYAGTRAAADALLRLAELYFDKAHYENLQAYERYEKLLEELDEDAELPPPPEPDYSKSLELYKEFIDTYPRHPHIVEALYLYGYTLAESGRREEASAIFARLLEQDPTGPLAPEAAFFLGEYYFEESELEAAAHYYRYVLRLDDPVFFARALYKLAWTYYKLGDYERSLLGFTELIDYADAHKDDQGPAAQEARDMREEAIQYIAVIFADADGLPGLLKYFEKIGRRPFEREVIRQLADNYYEIADYGQAQAVYAELVRRDPLARETPNLYDRIELCWTKLGRTEEVLATWRRYAEAFAPDSAWIRKWREQAPELARGVLDSAEDKGIRYALYWHGKGQEAKDPQVRSRLYAKALEAYQRFAKLFSESRRLGEAYFNMAEIHYELEHWDEAAQLYRRVTEIEMDPTNAIFADAAWNMILARRKALELYEASPAGKARLAREAAFRREREARKETTGPTGGRAVAKLRAGTGKGKTRKRLPRAARTLVETSLYYVRLYPLGERTPVVFYTTGDIYFRYGLYDRAREQYQKFVDRFPEHEFLLDAIKQITRTFIIEQKYGELVRWGYLIYESPLANRTEVYLYFTKILSGAMFKEALQLLERKRHTKAARVFLRLVERFPQSEFIDKAILNAAIAFQKAGDWDNSTRYFRTFVERYPRHEMAAQALFQTAFNAERVLDYPTAVSRYLELLDRYPKAKEAKDALFNAATLLAKLGEARRAADLYLLYIKRFPGEPDEADNLFYAAMAYYDTREFEAAERLFRRYLRHPKRDEREVEARYYLAKIAEASGDAKRWRQRLEEILVAYEKYTKAGKLVDPRYAAEAAFQLAEFLDASYRRIKLRLPQTVMARLLEKKAQLLTKVVEAYTKVIAYKDPYWSSAALHMIGEAYQHFADTLFEAPVPEEFTEEEIEIYQEELEDQAFPVEDKAMQAWRRNIDLAARLGIHNEWTAKSRERLVELYPELARVKAEERFVVATNEFFYRFPSSTSATAELRIEGPRVVYIGVPYRIENLVERYRLARTWSRRQRKAMLDFGLRPAVVVYEAKPVEIEGILKLWRKHFAP